VEQWAVPSAGQKEDTSCYRKVEVCCLIVFFFLLACIMDIKSSSEIQLQFQISLPCFYKFGGKVS
jgi:hypothetical protein